MGRWLDAFRLRTLPVAFAPVLTGSGLAILSGSFQAELAALTLLTVVALQVLSNLANDYGDFSKGVDDDTRVGPQRSLQSGQISPQEMKTAILVFILISAVSGISLVYQASQVLSSLSIFVLLALGILAILAAIFYTMGKKPYGYHAMGDLSVFLFFGLIGVVGTKFLQTGFIQSFDLLPATALGLLITGVLNVNNLRDEDADRAKGKQTIIVKMGGRRGKFYHLIIHLLAALATVLFAYLSNVAATAIPLLLAVFYMPVIKRVFQVTENRNMDPLLKKHAIGSFFYGVLFLLSALIV